MFLSSGRRLVLKLGLIEYFRPPLSSSSSLMLAPAAVFASPGASGGLLNNSEISAVRYQVLVCNLEYLSIFL
ncbi:hypothetical protein BJX70DRAFT_352492 [Aspergillus crustosus]